MPLLLSGMHCNFLLYYERLYLRDAKKERGLLLDAVDSPPSSNEIEGPVVCDAF